MIPTPAFTPGEWKAGEAAWYRGRHRDDTESGKRPITAGDHGVVANVYGKANARLIAAAPALYEACKLAEYAFRVPSGERVEEELKALELMRAALQKADGK